MSFYAYKNYFLVIVCVFCLQLTACMLGPNFHSPKAPQVRGYTEKPLPRRTIAVRGAGRAGKAQYFKRNQTLPADWWYLFRSPELNYLIVQGLKNNPSLISAQAALRQAQEAVNVQIGNSLFPAVSGQFTAERQKFSDATFGINGNNPIFNLFNPSFNISYTLDLFGAARRQVESLQAQVDYQAFQLEGTYLTLTSNIATAAINSASLLAQIQATHEVIRAQESVLTIVKKQFRLGGASGSDVLTQETTLAQTRAQLPALEQSLAQSQHVLAALIGTFPSETNIPIIHLEQLTLPRFLPLSLPSALVRQRPDIRASEALLHAANAQIGVATANLYPQFSINGAYGWESNTLSSLFKPHTIAWNYSGQILEQIFNGGALMAKKRQAVAAYEQAEAQYRQTVLQAFQNVADSLRAIENDADAFRAQREAELAAKDSLRLIQRQYRLGGVSYLALLNAERQYQQIKIGRIQAQASRYNDTVALFQALGGGWWTRVAALEAQRQRVSRRTC